MTAKVGISVNRRKTERLNDYFAIVGLDPEEELRATSDGLTYQNTKFGSNIHPLKAKYVSQVLHRFPYFDHEDQCFPLNLPVFCMPGGLRLKLKEEIPTFFVFVQTHSNGEHTYGFCLTFYEKLDNDTRNELQEICELWEKYYGEDSMYSSLHLDPQSDVFAPKCLCLLSSWPYFDSYRQWLTNLFLNSINPCEIPLERYICNFMLEVPNAIPGYTEVRYRMGLNDLHFRCPPPNKPIAWRSLPFSILFQCLSNKNIVSLFESILLERSVLLKSKQLFLLSAVSEVIIALLYPLSWTHVYIPVLPEALLGVIAAPMPFIVGVHSDWLEIESEGRSIEIPSNVIQVDLDCDRIELGSLPSIQLPSKRRAKLSLALSECPAISNCRESSSFVVQNADLAFSMAVRPCSRKETESESPSSDDKYEWDTVLEAFLRLFVSLLRGYHRFLVFPTKSDPSPSEPFLRNLFVERMESDKRQFMSYLVKTQAFQNFIDARTNPDPEDLDLILFDEGIEAKRNRSKLNVIKRDTEFLLTNQFSQLKTIYALTPDDTGLSEIELPPFDAGTFRIPNKDLYILPRDVPGLNKRRERQDTGPALTGKKKRHSHVGQNVAFSNCIVDSDEKFTAEECVFAIFIMGYCSCVGKEPTLSKNFEKMIFLSNHEKESGSPVFSSSYQNRLDSSPKNRNYSTDSYSSRLTKNNSAELEGTVISPFARNGGIFGAESSPKNESKLSMEETKLNDEGKNMNNEGTSFIRRKSSQDFSLECLSQVSNKTKDIGMPPKVPSIEVVNSGILKTCNSFNDEPKQMSPLNAPNSIKRKNSFDVVNRRSSLPPERKMSMFSNNTNGSYPQNLGKRTSKNKSQAKTKKKVDLEQLQAYVISALLYGNLAEPFSDLLKKCLDNSSDDIRLRTVKVKHGLQNLIPSVDRIINRQKDSNESPKSKDKFNSLETSSVRAERLKAAKCALGVGFEAIDIMMKGNLNIDEVIYRTLIDACLRCGDSERAIAAVEIMMGAGIRPDAAINSCLIEACSMDETMCQGNPFDLLDWSKLQTSATENSLSKKSDLSNQSKLFNRKKSNSNANSGVQNETKSVFKRWINRLRDSPDPSKEHTPRSRINSNDLTKKPTLKSSAYQNGDRTDRFKIQTKLGDQLLKVIFPDLVIDLESETCPRCGYKLSSADIKSGWERNSNTYTTTCPNRKCYNADEGPRKFAARFSVHSTSADWIGSTDEGSVLWCVYLSPWVLRKEVHTILKEYGVRFMCSSEFRQLSSNNATIFWNLVIHLRENKLPLTWLLAGVFAETLIGPTFFQNIQ